LRFSRTIPFAFAAALLSPLAPAETPRAPGEALAVVGGEPITRGEVEAAAGGRLLEVRNQEYNVLRDALEEKIARTLLAKEAARRGTTVEALLKSEVDEKVPPVSPEEQKKFYDENKARFGNTPEADALKNIETGLRQQRVRDRRQEVVNGLRTAAAVKVNLDPPRFPVTDGGDDPSKGPAKAPVTLVLFSDFECPFCSRIVPTLKRIEERYGERVRVVFRDLPLPQIHKHAAKAAEAGACAHEQGKFWEMHDHMFGHQKALSVDDLKKAAAEIGLKTDVFGQCLDSGRFAAEWKADAAEANSFGITGTPASFVNGRFVSGAQSFEYFVRVIDEELERAGLPIPKAPSPAVS
jgi:protein-disulfide isomerase